MNGYLSPDMIFYGMRTVRANCELFGVYPWISLSFSEEMLGHVTRLDQSRADKNIQ